MAEEYTEEIKEAVKANLDYLNNANADDVALFLESIADSIYDNTVVEQIAAALRDVDEGVI